MIIKLIRIINLIKLVSLQFVNFRTIYRKYFIKFSRLSSQKILYEKLTVEIFATVALVLNPVMVNWKLTFI